jgi:hypothetical protein
MTVTRAQTPTLVSRFALPAARLVALALIVAGIVVLMDPHGGPNLLAQIYDALGNAQGAQALRNGQGDQVIAKLLLAAVALLVGVGGIWLLFIGAGALVNTYYLLTGYAFEDFADAGHFAFVRDTWRAVVVPHSSVWIGLLIAFELTVGLLVLSRGRRAQVGLVAVIGMHLALPVFGWITTVWALVMLLAFGLLLRAEYHATARPDAHVGSPARTPAT